jgi:hypothetical protein
MGRANDLAEGASVEGSGCQPLAAGSSAISIIMPCPQVRGKVSPAQWRFGSASADAAHRYQPTTAKSSVAIAMPSLDRPVDHSPLDAQANPAFARSDWISLRTISSRT